MIVTAPSTPQRHRHPQGGTAMLARPPRHLPNVAAGGPHAPSATIVAAIVTASTPRHPRPLQAGTATLAPLLSLLPNAAATGRHAKSAAEASVSAPRNRRHLLRREKTATFALPSHLHRNGGASGHPRRSAASVIGSAPRSAQFHVLQDSATLESSHRRRNGVVGAEHHGPSARRVSENAQIEREARHRHRATAGETARLRGTSVAKHRPK